MVRAGHGIRWLSLAGANHVSAHRGTRFSLAELALQAAIDGAGVVLGRMVLAEGDLAVGRWVRPCVPSMIDSLEVEVLYPDGWR